MEINKLVAAISIAVAATMVIAVPVQAADGGSNISPTTSTKIEDPYADDQSNSPWAMSMENVTTFGGRVVRGDSTLIDGKNFQSFNAYTPYFPDKTTALGGYGSSKVSVGCDGINLGGVIDGQLAQYQQMVEQFIQNAPALAIMYLAYSQPTVKAVIDELNGVSQFGLDLTNMSCSGVRAIADKSAEDKAQAMAEARCTAEAGFKDPNCMADDGLLESVTQVMKDTKQTVTDRSSQYLGKVSSATGGLVSFRTGNTSGNTGSNPNNPGAGPTNEYRQVACDRIDSEGLRTLILAASGIPCEDIENYGALLPDYQISENGESGVIPRTLTLRKLASDLVVKHEGWVNQVMGTEESEFVNSDAYKAIYNRTGVAITVQQHRKINNYMTTNRSAGLAMIRNLSQLIALKDLYFIVNNLEVAVLTGIQNQPDDELLSTLRKKQYAHAIETLKAELSNLTEEINLDLKRNDIIKTT